MTHSFTLDYVYNKADGRNWAMRRLVTSTPYLNEEFKKKYSITFDDILDRSRFVECLDDFVKKRGLRVIKETPKAKADDNGCYHVAVSYLIEVP